MSKQAIFWVVPEASPKNAGYRVRTVPLARALEQFSITPRIVPTSDFVSSIELIANEAAVVIVAKPSDTVMFLCMKYLVSRGVRVLADIFDNYFSWSGTLYQRGLHWQWLRAVDPDACSGVITSTPYLADVLRKIGFSDVCQVSDLAPSEAQLDDLAGMELNNKWRDPEQIEILWYGISGNPYFRAGLDDLISWTRVTARIRDRLHGHRRMRLTICTNQVPAVGAALKSFASEGINTRFVAWTAEGCDELLQASHLVLLPSNLSGFSLSKTHNRCSDAFWRHCLVLASPNGPYRDLHGAVYRDVNELCGDLIALDRLRITAKLCTSISEISRTYAKLEHAERLARFISIKKRRQDNGPESMARSFPQVLVLGSTVIRGSVDWAQRLGYLTACFDGSHRNHTHDYVFKSAGSAAGKATIRMSDAGKAALQKIWPNGDERQDIGLRFERIDEAQSLTMTLPILQPLLEAAELVEAIVDAHSDLRERMHDIHAEIIITALRALGFSKFDYSTEAAGGWKSYASLAAPRLRRAVFDLLQTWQQHQGNEQGIGRPLPSRTTVRGVVNA